MAMKKSISRTLAHIDVAATVPFAFTKTFSTATPVIDSYPESLIVRPFKELGRGVTSPFKRDSFDRYEHFVFTKKQKKPADNSYVELRAHEPVIS